MIPSNLKSIYNRYEKSKISEQTKIREILQQTALLGLQRHGFFEKAAFYGGTALRLLYGLDRFSENLDFSLFSPNPDFDFTPYLEGMRKELNAMGFQMEVKKKEKNIETTIVSAFMKINTIELFLAIGEETKANHNEQVQIKLEVDIDPPPHSRLENHLLLNPTAFYVVTLHKSDLFAGKMAAILFRARKGRVKGRDWYDLIWYIQNDVPLSLTYLESCLRQSGNWEHNEPLSRQHLIQLLEAKIASIDWESAKADMRAFIADPKRLDIWSPAFFNALIQHLKVETQ